MPTGQRSRRGWGAVRRLASGRWQARYPDPDTARLVPAPQTFAAKADASRWLAAKQADLDRGYHTREREGTLPLQHWWPGYLRSIKGRLRPSTVANYEQAWRLRIAPTFESMPVRRIQASLVDEWITTMVDAGASPSKVVEAHGVLKRVLDRVVRDGVIPANPCGARQRSLPRRPTTDRPVLSPVEVERLARHMGRHVDRLLVRLLAYAGLRIGEALALEVDDVDVALRMVRIRRSVDGTLEVGPTKTHAHRTVVLPESLAAQLRAHLEAQEGPLVFPNRNGGYRRYRTFRRDTWDPAARSIGLSVTPHDLRATCASLLIDAGASVKDVQAQLGHADVTTTLNLYARVRPGRSADLASRLDQLISSENESDQCESQAANGQT